MNTTATTALELAQRMLDSLAASDIDNAGIEIDGEIYTADEIRGIIRRGLESLRQQPLLIDGLQVHVRLRNAVTNAGSEAELARRIGITRQALNDVLNSRREPGPTVLAYLRLKKVPVGRTMYTPDDEGPRAPAPRSDRRQRAWDGNGEVRRSA